MTRSQRLLITVLLAAGLALPACEKSKLEPGAIVFPHAFVGMTSHVALNFTLGGQSVGPFQVTIIQDGSQFVFDSEGALGVLATLSVSPTTAGLLTAKLLVVAGNESATVDVTAFAVPPPGCPTAEPVCFAATLDPDTGECMAAQAGDGTPCANDNCESQWRCEGGHCTSSELTNAVHACAPASPSPSAIAPAWTYSTPFYPVDGHLGVYDAYGNQFLEECELSGSGCDLVSVTIDGVESWRVSKQKEQPPFTVCATDSLSLMVMGELLLVPTSDLTSCVIEGRSAMDGTLLWTYSVAAKSYGIASVADQGLLAVIGYSDGPSSLTLLDLTTGQEALSSAPPAASTRMLGSSIVGDGAGNLWSVQGLTQTVVPPAGMDDLTIFNVASGTPEVFNVPGPSVISFGSSLIPMIPQVCAANGSTVVTTVAAMSGGSSVRGYPTGDDVSSCEVVSTDPAKWQSLATSINAACPGTFLDTFDTQSGLTSRCLASTGIPVLGQDGNRPDGVQFLTATANGGAGFLQWSEGTPYFVAVDSNARPVKQYQLGGFPAKGVTSVSTTALIGGRWIVNLMGSTTTILAYDLPGVTGATEGWNVA